MKMKKIITILLAVLLFITCFALFACGGEDEQEVQPTVYSITYDVAGGELPQDAIKTYTVSKTDIKLPVPTKDKNDFLGWLEDGKTELVTVIAAGTKGNKTFIAVWRSQFEVVINNASSQDFTAWTDGTTGSKTVWISSGAKLTIPEIVWDTYDEYTKNDFSQYYFEGWFYEDKSGEEKMFDQSVAITSDNLNIDGFRIEIKAKVGLQYTNNY